MVCLLLCINGILSGRNKDMHFLFIFFLAYIKCAALLETFSVYFNSSVGRQETFRFQALHSGRIHISIKFAGRLPLASKVLTSASVPLLVFLFLVLSSSLAQVTMARKFIATEFGKGLTPV